MKLTEEIKNKIRDILGSEEFKTNLYSGLTEEKRKELGQFYTPADICIQMIERFNCDSLAEKNILDPTCGSGNLLIACLIAGADSEALYGNEYDNVAVELCRKRINRCCDILGKDHINDYQIHQGNALHEFALKEFRPDYEELYFDGKTDKKERQKLLDTPEYNAYKNNTFKYKCPEDYKKRESDDTDNYLRSLGWEF